MPTRSDSLSQAKSNTPLLPNRFLLFFLGMLGSLLACAQSLQEAERLSQSGYFVESNETYAQFIAKNPRRTYDHSVAWFGIGYNYLQLGDYEAALIANQHSKTIREQLPVDDVAENYMRFGLIYLQMGAYEKSLANLRQAKSLPVVEPYMFAQMEGLIANVYSEMDNFREAETHFQLALESFMVESGEFSPDVVTTLHQLGKMYQTQGRTSEAKETYLRALRIEETLRDNSERMGLVLNALGEIVWKETGHLAARSYFLRARRAVEANSGSHHALLARIALNLSKAALADGDRGQAATEIMEAYRVLFPGFSSVNFLQNPGATLPCLQRVLAAEAYLQKARCIANTSTTALSQDAVQLYAEALQLLEKEALTYPSAERRQQILEFLPQLSDEAIFAALHSENKAHAALAFEWAERTKALWLHVQTAIPTFDSTNQVSHLHRQWRQLEHQIMKAPEDAALARLLGDTQKAYLEQLDHSPRGLDFRPFSIQAVQAGLDDATAMVAYYIGAQQYGIFALTRDEFSAMSMPFNYTPAISRPTKSQQYNNGPEASPVLHQSANGLLNALRNFSSGDFTVYASDLYNKLIQPFYKMLADKKNLVVIPHDLLTLLPFESFLSSPVEAPDKKTYNKLPYLIKTYSVEYRFSAALWTQSRQTTKNALAYTAWAPVFDTPETQAALAEALRRSEFNQPTLSAYGVPELPVLIESVEQVQIGVKAWNQRPDDTQIFLRQKATESSVREMAGQSKVAHFVTQGIAQPMSLRYSGLILAPSDANDGILYLSEIQSLNWNGALCVLNNSYHLTEPVSNTLPMSAYAFVRAGAGGVVSTLWSGHNQAQIRLLTAFFSQQATGISTPEALRRAKLSLIKDKTMAEPLKWSGLIYFGN